MKCFGDKTKTFHCKVVLLDEQELIQEVQETTSGQDLLDTVYQHLNLIETAYFGLRFIDPSNQTHWLDPSKRLSKQLKGTSPYTLYFSVKFYAADPTKLVEEITRYQFFLQTKQDILQGRLPISTELVAELGSFAVQSELGDYDPRRHSPGYVSEFRFVTNQIVDLENKIADLHKKLVGYVPSKAEICYLEKVKWLDMYGVDLHSVLGEDSTEYFLGLTPSGIIVLRNKVKVGNYFWPRITKVYFRGRFFMLRVKDKNNSENTYGFETPSKSACKHLWQCCVEHHAFFRLTQAAGTSPQAIFSLGSKYSGRTEKEAVSDAKVNSRPQTEFARTPSRRYQRRIVEGANDTPRVDDADHKPETRTVVSLPGTVTPVSSHVYRSTSLTLAPRSDSPRSIRSAPHPSGLQHKGISAHFGSSTTKRTGRSNTRDESPGSVKSVSNGRVPEDSDRTARRTSSVESQSSVDSRGCNRSCSRHRRSRCRSSDGESEASSKCSSKGHRRHHHKHHHHRHRNHSDDSSDQHKHRRRRHRHRSSERPEPQLVESSGQWAKVQSGETPAKSNTATVRDLTSGYMPSGHEDTELDNSVHHHSSRRKHRKHRSRSRSPSEGKHKNYPDEIRRHIDFGLQNTEGLTEAQLKEIPYTKVETAKTVKIRYGSPKGKRHKSPKRSKSNSSDRKPQPQQLQNDVKEVPSNMHIQGTYNENYKNGSTNGNDGGTMERIRNGKIPNENEYRNDNDSSILNGNVRPCPRTNRGLMGLTTSRESSPLDERVASLRSSPQRDSSPLRNFQETGILQRARRESPQSSPLCDYGPKSGMVNGQGRSYTLSGNNRSSYNNQVSYSREQSQHPINNINNYINTSENTHSQYQPHRNPPTGGVFLQPLHDSSHTQEEEEGEMSSGFVDSNSGGFMSPSPILIKNATLERGSHFTTVLKPQPSPQSSVTSGISIGSSSTSATVNETADETSYKINSTNHYPSAPKKSSIPAPNNIYKLHKGHVVKLQENFNQLDSLKPNNICKGYENKPKMNNILNGFPEYDESTDQKKFSPIAGDQNSFDKGYHTLEKLSNAHLVNFRNTHNQSNNHKLVKCRPNSFSYEVNPRINGLCNNDNGYNNSNSDKNSFQNNNSKICKPILKSFASEDNLNSHLNLKDRSVSSDRLNEAGSSMNNSKNRVRWNIQEKNKNLANLKDRNLIHWKEGNIIYKPRDLNPLARANKSTNNIHNVKNDVVYAGQGDIIEIKNNQVINIKSIPNTHPKSFTRDIKRIGTFFRDETSTEL